MRGTEPRNPPADRNAIFAPSRRRLAAFAVLIVTITGLSACSANAGSSGGEKFEKFLADEPDVVDVRTAGTNNLPFYGSVGGSVTVTDDASEKRVGELADLIAGYINKHDSTFLSWSPVRLEIGDFALSVDGVQAHNDEMLSLYSQLKATDGVVGATIDDRTLVDASSAAELVGVYDAAAALLGDTHRADTPLTATARGFVVSGGETGIRPDAAIDAFTAAAATFDLVGAALNPHAFGLKLQRQTDVAAATAFIAALPYAASLGPITVTSGLVTQTGEGDFTQVNGIVDRIGAVTGLLEVESTPTQLTLTVDSVTAAQRVDALIGDAVDAATLESLRYQFEGDDPEFVVIGTDYAVRQSSLATAALLLTDDFVESIVLNPSGGWVVVANTAGLVEFAPSVKRAFAAGSGITVQTVDREFQLEFTAVTPLIVVPPYFDDETTDPLTEAAFIAAWNAAP
ncbi:hypothetical protein [Cryobacterium luteum]|uniref:Uncharacterized protein n=1 Tax=Cryobacterium luteum TaxID=1424661 RepID=A0A1H8HZ39_9MICO|nr:hypothetical protein [Cryobacterium luteum]TFB94238.1 hypothetical protein E3O10_01985 [Cryobacterium luteum]SEN61529.1 hypothetical protein SAMN05216281_11096 [Cryobacterium luteum]